MVHLSCRDCTAHTQTPPADPSDSPFHKLKKGAMPSHQKFLHTGLASGLQREKKEDGTLLKGGRMKARVVGCSSTMSQPTLTIVLGKGVLGLVMGRAHILAARGIPSPRPRHSSAHMASVCWGWKRLSCGFWFLPMAVAVLSLPAQGKPQAILWFHSDTFILSASSCHPHSAEDILFGNFSFNSFNSSVNRQLPLLSNCLSHFLSEQSSVFTLQYFLFTFSTSSDIFPFLAEAGC